MADKYLIVEGYYDKLFYPTFVTYNHKKYIFS